MTFDEPGIQAITLSLISVAALLSLVGVAVGLFSGITGRDPLPKRIRRLLRRAPASADDFRLRGMSVVLNAAAVLLLTSISTVNVAGGLALGGWSGYAPAYAPAGSVAFPKATVFLVTTVAALAAFACFIGAYILGVRVRYVSARATGAQPGEMPPG